MSGEWTPGPWRVGEWNPNSLQIPITDSKGEPIAAVWGGNEEARANARQAAAAPDLYEALQPFVDLGPQRGAWGVISKALDGMAALTVTVTKAQMLAALTALSRARGEHPDSREGRDAN